MEGLKRDDTNFILKLYMETAESFRSKTEKAAKSATALTPELSETVDTKPSVVKSKKNVKTVTKSVKEEDQRSRNVMLFGLKETAGEELTKKVDKVLKKLGFEMKHESKRVGSRKKNRRNPRPVKVTLIDSESAKQILRKSRESKVDGKLTIAPDRSPQERAQRKLLKKETKRKKVKESNKKHSVKEGVVCSAVS